MLNAAIVSDLNLEVPKNWSVRV